MASSGATAAGRFSLGATTTTTTPGSGGVGVGGVIGSTTSSTPMAGISNEPPRQRQHFPPYGTPGNEYHPPTYHSDVKDTQHVPSPGYELNGYSNYRPSYPNGSSGVAPPLYSNTPLSTFLARSFAQARKSFGASPSLKPGTPPTDAPIVQSTLTSIRESVPFILLCSAWYMSSAMSSNTGKSILTRFRYPVTLTFVQFAFVAGYCALILAARERLAVSAAASGGLTSARRGSIPVQGWGIRKPSRTMFQGTLMMSLFQIGGHIFSSMAIARVPVSTVHTIKALSPLFTVVAYAALFRVSYSSATYFALLPLTIGVMLACSFDLRANAVGFLCALGSTLVFVSQNIFSKKLLPKESGSGAPLTNSGPNSGKLDKLNLLFYSSGMAFVLMIPIWAYSDGRTLLFNPPSPVTTNAPVGTTASLVFNFFLNGTVHFAQNLLAFSILARTSPVTYSIASLVKRIAVICLAILWSGQKVSFIQGFGMTMTFAGLWMYNRAKSDVDKGERKRGQVEKRQQMYLPTTSSDARDLDGVPTPPPGLGIISPSMLGSTTSHLSNTSAFSPTSQSAHHFSAPPPQYASNASYGSSAGAAAPPPPRSQQGRHESPSSLTRNRSFALPVDKIGGRRSWESSGSGRTNASPTAPHAQLPPVVQSSVRYL